MTRNNHFQPQSANGMKSPAQATAWLSTRCSPRTSYSKSPVVHTPQRGKAVTALYLRSAIAVLGGAEFRYVAEWIGAKSAVLEFVTIVDGIEINGVDITGWTADEKIDRFKVMVRPLKAIQILHPRCRADDAIERVGKARSGKRPVARPLRASSHLGPRQAVEYAAFRPSAACAAASRAIGMRNGEHET